MRRLEKEEVSESEWIGHACMADACRAGTPRRTTDSLSRGKYDGDTTVIGTAVRAIR
jgi:hypothetical protein